MPNCEDFGEDDDMWRRPESLAECERIPCEELSSCSLYVDDLLPVRNRQTVQLLGEPVKKVVGEAGSRCLQNGSNDGLLAVELANGSIT